MVDLSVVVPCHNEAGQLLALKQALVATMTEHLPELAFEVVLVDDGSTDGTAELIEQICAENPHFRGLSFSRNFGKESAMLAGLEASVGQYVVIMDADLQHPPELIPELYHQIVQNGVDQVIARRNRAGDSFWRSLVSKAYYRLVNSMVDVKLQDGEGDFRILSRRAVTALVSLRETNRFSKGLFSWIGFPTEVMEYQNVTRDGGTSSWSTKSLINYGIEGVVSFNSKPLRSVIYLGAIIFGLSLLYLVYLLGQYLVVGVTTPGYVTTIAVIIMFGGAQLFGLGIVGEYVGRLYQEVKSRPHYLVYRTFGQSE